MKEERGSLLLQVYGLLGQLVDGRDYAVIRLVVSLKRDQVRKLLGDVDIRRLERFADDVSDAARLRLRRRKDDCVGGSAIDVVPDTYQGVGVANIAESDTRNLRIRAVGVAGDDMTAVGNPYIGERRRRLSVLRETGHR